MAAADLRCLLAELEEMEELGRLLGIEATLQELRTAARSAAGHRSRPRQELLELNHRTDVLLEKIWSWHERHGGGGGRPRTGEDFVKGITLIKKYKFRREVVEELNKITAEYRKNVGDEDETILFKGRVTGKERNVTKDEDFVGRNEDVNNILVLMYSRSLYIPRSNYRALRKRLAASKYNTEKLQDILKGRWRPVAELVDDSHFLSIIPIVGTPGIGKTAVAQTVLHEAFWFDERIWVHVSPLFDRKRVLQRMAEELGYHHDQQQKQQEQQKQQQKHRSPDDEEDDEDDEVMTFLKERMKEKSYLLVLDDLWNEDQKAWDALTRQLSKVAAASGKIGNMVIVTTRSRVAAKMNSDCYELQGLSEDNSRKLLRESAKDSQENHEQLPQSVQKTLKKCYGVPVAIDALDKFIRRSLRDENFDTNFRFMPEDNPELLDSFRLSYELLFPVHLRNSLQFCTLFPEEHVYDMEEFSDILIAQRYAPQIEDHTAPRPEAAHFANLWKDCFQKVESSSSGKATYKLSPLMRELSLSYSSTRDNTVLESVHHLPSLVNSETSEFPRALSRNLKALVLVREPQMVLSGERCKISVIPEDSLAGLNHLCVLDLQCTMIKKLPGTIGKLLSLRYLNLSETDIAILPQSIRKLRSLMFLKLKNCKHLRKLDDGVTDLVNLRKLDLSGCRCLVEVPWGMENMKQLSCLNIMDCTSMERMPYGIGQLTNLRTLPRYIVGEKDLDAISELQRLEKLEGELRLENLERVRVGGKYSKAWLHEKGMLKSLALVWKDDSKVDGVAQEEVLRRLQPTAELIKLEIISYAGKEFPIWMTGRRPYLTSLEEIRLFNLKGCQTLPPLGALPRLRIAEISGMDAVTKVDKDFFGVGGNFPCLQKLTFSEMLNLERWLDVAGEGKMLPCLTDLRFIHCPKLVALEMRLPRLKELSLWMNNERLCTSKDGLKSLSGSLEKLSIGLCEDLPESSQLEGLRGLGSLQELKISGCQLTHLPDGIEYLNLKRLIIITTKPLEETQSLPWRLVPVSLPLILIDGRPTDPERHSKYLAQIQSAPIQRTEETSFRRIFELLDGAERPGHGGGEDSDSEANPEREDAI